MAELFEVKVPDIGDFKDVPVIEVFVKPGDRIAAEDSLITVESDKATMEVPSPAAGVVKELRVKIGDKVSEGSPVLVLEKAEGAARTAEAGPQETDAREAPPSAPAERHERQEPREGGEVLPAGEASRGAAPSAPAPEERPAAAAPAPADMDERGFAKAHASPAVRRFARELGVDLGKIRGSGPKERILREDVQAYVKSALGAAPAAAAAPGLALPPPPQIDFSRFGSVRTQALTRIQKLSGANLHRNWVSIPHVTQNDEADVTDLEAFRKAESEQAKAQGIRLTLLAFLMKASVTALKRHPQFNASLSSDGESLVVKEYYNIGVAVDTPNGLVVPVIREVDRKGLLELARELAEVSARAREGKLAPGDMQGGSFSISSLGGIGGTTFTPIINAPEVAILGVGRSAMKPVWNGSAFVPRLILPLSLSYDHRVIDGALGARFLTFLSTVLTDIRKLVL
jgi:pyruvate dehydrogenase E2 component (dihydrolipoamide acetyltransferase)